MTNCHTQLTGHCGLHLFHGDGEAPLTQAAASALGDENVVFQPYAAKVVVALKSLIVNEIGELAL